MIFDEIYIKSLIEKEISPETRAEIAMQIFQRLLQFKSLDQILTFYELYRLMPKDLDQMEAYNVAFSMVDLSVPIFSIIIELNDVENKEIEETIILENPMDVYKILDKQKIVHPDTGEYLEYSYYQHYISFLFKLNKILFKELKAVKE